MKAITDSDHVCSRCGEHYAKCELCSHLESAVVYRPQRQRADDREIELQERAIRDAADRRQGWR